MIPPEWLKDTQYLINPTGRFVIGGPQGDCGLTGRKIIVDTYGGACPHGGGAFSGKGSDQSRPQRRLRRALCGQEHPWPPGWRQCQIQVSYAIGVAHPINITVYTEGTGVIDDHLIEKLVRTLRPAPQGHHPDVLDLLRPIYSKTVAYGHFGRSEPEFSGNKPTIRRTSCDSAVWL